MQPTDHAEAQQLTPVVQVPPRDPNFVLLVYRAFVCEQQLLGEANLITKSLSDTLTTCRSFCSSVV